MTNEGERFDDRGAPRAGHARVTLAAAAIVCALVPTMSARAVTPEDRAAADQLFNEGRALVKSHDYAAGCAKLASSEAFDPAAGTLLALGDCYELNGQTASAWATFNDAEAMSRKSGDDARADEAARRAGLLKAKLSKLVVDLPKEEATPATVIRRNGKPVEASMVGSEIPVDPGKQTIDVEIPGREPWHTEVSVPPNASVTTVKVPILRAAAGGSSWSGQRTAGIVVGVVGLAGLGVGAGFGALALSKVGSIDDGKLCDKSNPPRCSQAGLDLEHQANDMANVSNVALAVGGALLATGIVIFATAPQRKKPAVGALEVRSTFGPMGGSVGMSGSF